MCGRDGFGGGGREDPVGRRVERAVQHQDGDGDRDRGAVHAGEHQAVAEQQDAVSCQEEPETAHTVRERAHRDREQQKRRGRAERQQREEVGGQAQFALEEQIEEGVADGGEPEQGGAEREAAQAGAAQQRERVAQGGAGRGGGGAPSGGRGGGRGCGRRGRLGRGRRGGPGCGRRGRLGGDPARHEEDQDEDPECGDAAADREDRVIAVDRGPEHGERRQRAEHGAGGVHGAVHTECPAPVFGPRGQRDHRVPGGGPKALARAVGGQHGADAGEGVHEQEQRFAQGGQSVSEPCHHLVPPAAPVREVAADQPDQRADTVVDAVQQPEAEGREAESRDHVEREDGGDHFRGDIGDQADRTEGQDGAGHGGPPPRAGVRGGG